MNSLKLLIRAIKLLGLFKHFESKLLLLNLNRIKHNVGIISVIKSLNNYSSQKQAKIV